MKRFEFEYHYAGTIIIEANDEDEALDLLNEKRDDELLDMCGFDLIDYYEVDKDGWRID